MRIKILILVAFILIIFMLFVRYQFKIKFKEFKAKIHNYELSGFDEFRTKKKEKFKQLQRDNKEIYHLYVREFNEQKSVENFDTIFSYLYLSDKIKYRKPSVNYINCLNEKCNSDFKNVIMKKELAMKEKFLKEKYDRIFELWYPLLKDSNLIKVNKLSNICAGFFPTATEIELDDNTWNEFDQFLSTYKRDRENIENENNQTLSDYQHLRNSVHNQLIGKAVNDFDQSLIEKETSIISKSKVSKRFNGAYLGNLTYNITKINFDKPIFEEIAEKAFEEQWKYNSLNIGEMPYAYCYGSSNYCSDYGCSTIEVKTGSSDVLVTVKDNLGEVIRHAFITTGSTFTFNLPNGRYQVFFYSGTGWNPYKYMTTSSCGDIKGGFVSFENFTKDDYISLYNQSMYYELISQENGNLHIQPSNMNEAFK